MRKLYVVLLILISISGFAQDQVVIFKKAGIKTEILTSSIDSVTFPNTTIMRIHNWDATVTDIPLAEIDSIKTIPDLGTAKTDSEALIVFYNAAGGPNWTNNTNWCSNKPLNEWYGVYTNLKGRVTGLNLDFNNLQGFIPGEFANLTNLKTLILQVNQLSGSIPIEFGNLTSLEYLNLGSNKFTGSIPNEFGKLINLNNLELFGNQFTGNIPLELKKLIKLCNLGLSDNQLTGSIPTELSSLLKLQRLSLANNQLTGSIPKELVKLSDLNELRLCGNQLSGIIPIELTQLSKLQTLALGRNPFSGSIPLELFQLSNLKYLDLDGIKFKGTIPTELSRLSSLEYLYLSNNQFTGTIPSELGQLTSLTNLSLSNNELTGSIPPELGNLSKLQLLSLSSNFLTGSIPSEFGRLMNIEYLNLSCNHLDGEIPAELGQLQKLKYFVLNFNYYIGEIPREIAILYSLPKLTELDITNNRFFGVVPTSLINHPKWNELVWGIVKQQPEYVFERETVKTVDASVADIDNKIIDLDSLFASNKLTVVFKWSLSDPYSGKFIPILKSVNQAFIDKGLGVISYIRASIGEVNSIKNYISDNQMSWTNLIIDYGAEFSNFPGMTVPNVHIVNQNGEIVFSDQLWDKREDFEKFITSQLGPMEFYQSKDYNQDGKVTKLQSATIGKGVNIVLMGDGFVDTTLVSGGLYEQTMQEAMEHFFSVEPTKSYREYFNVYAVKAVSKNGVFMDRSETIFSSKFGENRGINGDIIKIKEYAQKVEGINSAETHIITILNSTGHAGQCYMYDDGSVSFISMPSDVESFAGVLQHEAIGHGLGKLGDEYIDYYESISQEAKYDFLQAQTKGWCQNLSLSQTNPPWAHFFGNSNYTMVGTYEGGYYYWKGVWRAEENSSMIVSKLHYFNGPSREQIVKRTLQAAGVTYSWNDFLANDKDEPPLKSAPISNEESDEMYELNTVPATKMNLIQRDTYSLDNFQEKGKYVKVFKSATIIPEENNNEDELLAPPVIMNKKLFE